MQIWEKTFYRATAFQTDAAAPDGIDYYKHFFLE